MVQSSNKAAQTGTCIAVCGAPDPAPSLLASREGGREAQTHGDVLAGVDGRADRGMDVC